MPQEPVIPGAASVAPVNSAPLPDSAAAAPETPAPAAEAPAPATTPAAPATTPAAPATTPAAPMAAPTATAPAPAAAAPVTTPAVHAPAPSSSAGQPAKAGNFTAEDVENAVFTGQPLASGQTALTAKVQALLDRSGISPGVTDGWAGRMSESAIMAFERRSGLPEDGLLDQEVWSLLQTYAGKPIIQNYTITQEDTADLVDSNPRDYAEKAKMKWLGFTSLPEKLGERFHMDEKFIVMLNKGTPFEPGNTIKVIAPAKPITGKVTRILVNKQTSRVTGYNAAGSMLVDYPATIGSDATPSPSGTHFVDAVALDPTYHYNPRINKQQGENAEPLVLPPGPNGPVGSVWIDLSKPTYGIHGTPTPSQLFRNQSSGCVRLTNWDARELAKMVEPKVTTVEFIENGAAVASAVPGAPGAQPTASPAPAAGGAKVPGVYPPVLDGTAEAAAIAVPSPSNQPTSAPAGGAGFVLPQAAPGASSSIVHSVPTGN
ncbi:L,D-transpeptidase family protein [Paracoccus pacificus]|uniref:L,D-transpeptidase family protein n=1 Tax=Paracoccus pacificus TaxID=1463598 RepID=A0ABW4R8M3_9RHOB